MAIIRHTTQYSDAYLDISYYVPPHQYTPAEIEMYLISPRPQFPPHEPAVQVREFLIVSDLNHRTTLLKRGQYGYLATRQVQYSPSRKRNHDPRPVLGSQGGFKVQQIHDDWFEDLLDEAEEEIEIEAIADPIAHRDIVTAFYNATNIEYPQKKKTSWIRRGMRFLRRTIAPLRRR